MIAGWRVKSKKNRKTSPLPTKRLLCIILLRITPVGVGGAVVISVGGTPNPLRDLFVKNLLAVLVLATFTESLLVVFGVFP